MMNDPTWRFGMGRRTALLAVSATAAILVLTVASVSATWLLSGRAVEPNLPKVTFGPAEEWPEIRNGVPELAAVRPSPRPAGVPTARPPAGIDEAPRLAIARAQDAPAASGVGQPSGVLAPETPRAAAVGSQNAAIVEPPIAAGPVALAEPRPVAEAAAPSPIERPAPPAPLMTAVAPADPRPRTSTPIKSRNGEAKTSEAKKGEARRAVSNRDRGDASRASPTAQPGATADARAPSEAASPPPRKPAGPARTRTAAMPPTPPPPAVAREPEEPRTRLLGIPLPTGREVKECLLELRC